MSKCWRCKKETEKKYGNGMCLDCFTKCSHASEVAIEMQNDFEDGELSDSDWDREFKRRLKE